LPQQAEQPVAQGMGHGLERGCIDPWVEHAVTVTASHGENSKPPRIVFAK
jgi:hypothetical protein